MKYSRLSFYFFAIAILVVFSYFVFGGQFFASPSSFTLNQSQNFFYNISVNNTLVGGENLTVVNITLPAGFTFIAGTNGSSTPAAFSNTSTVLSWSNSSWLVINLTRQFFWFNATANGTAAYYNITVMMINASSAAGYVNITNITVNVTDSTVPANISFVSPTPSNGANTSLLIVNVSATDDAGGLGIRSIRIRLYNASNSLINDTNSTTNPYGFIFTGLADGTYKFNATANDTTGNLNLTGSGTRTIIVDSTYPIMNVSEKDSTDTYLAINITSADSQTGITICNSSRGSITNSTDGYTVTESGLTCGSGYIYNLSCTNTAGLTNSTLQTFTTDACATSSSSSGGSSGGGSYAPVKSTDSNSWTSTYAQDDVELSAKGEVSKPLSVHQRIRVKVNGEAHNVGITSITETSASVEVSSTPQQATLNVGEEKKFDLNGDGYYDILVRLVSITDGKANITISQLNENVSSQTEDNLAEESASLSPSSSSIGLKFWIVIVLIVAVAAYFVAKKMKVKKHKK